MQQRTTPFRASVRDTQLTPWTLLPEQVVDGAPQASGAVLWKSDDGLQANGVWECTPGSFRRTYPWSETMVLLSGAARITAGSIVLEMKAGDMGFLPQGVTAEWEIAETVRKAFYLASDAPLPV